MLNRGPNVSINPNIVPFGNVGGLNNNTLLNANSVVTANNQTAVTTAAIGTPNEGTTMTATQVGLNMNNPVVAGSETGGAPDINQIAYNALQASLPNIPGGGVLGAAGAGNPADLAATQPSKYRVELLRILNRFFCFVFPFCLCVRVCLCI